MTTREIPLFLDGPEGQLEALHLATPDAKGVALICHPHPLFAGTLQNKVVATLQRAARDAGYATLRFNFRGVGQSAGSYAEGAVKSTTCWPSRTGWPGSIRACR